MQNLSRSGSEDETPKMPDLSQLPPMPTLHKVQISTVVVCLLLAVMSAWCFYRSNWLGGCIDLAIIAVNVVFAVIRYRSLDKLLRQHRNLLTIQKILSTPVMAEEGNSMILTFIRPSDRLMEEMKQVAEEVAKQKSPPK